jgi:hypothetical protein
MNWIGVWWTFVPHFSIFHCKTTSHTSYVPTTLKKNDHVTGKFTYCLPPQPDEKPVSRLGVGHMTYDILTNNIDHELAYN